ncbi:RNase Sy [Dichotomocladium elegans]|nr:RNase Sy [Dichotomocladium elegans]
MKFATSSILAIGCAMAVSAVPSSLYKRADSCPVDAISCSSSSGGSCCTPTNGLLVLVQQWVKGYGPSDAFTLHGLWPDTCSGGIPGSGDSGCDSSRNYDDVGAIVQDGNSTLYDSMNTYWPSYKGDNGAFWTHEWNKHGTCVSTYDPECYGSSYNQYDDVYDYFSKALELRETYDLYAILEEAGITPGGSYSSKEMISAIESSTGATPRITCSSGTISEIWLFFNVKGSATYVPTDATSGSSCSGDVDYPAKN